MTCGLRQVPWPRGGYQLLPCLRAQDQARPQRTGHPGGLAGGEGGGSFREIWEGRGKTTGRRLGLRVVLWTQVQNPNDFVPLEPWAVPCGNAWMKDNADKWQGYSFYSAATPIDECLTMTFSVNIQPVGAFIGGVSIKVMPEKWAEILTTICWPKSRPGGLDLSVLKTEIKSHGISLFSRTLRLTKRFGDGNAFFPHNVYASTSTWKKINIPRASMSRTKLLQTDEGLNHSGHSEDEDEVDEVEVEEKEDESLWQWQTDPEDLYLASGNFTDDGLNLTSELYGHAVAHHLGLLQEAEGDSNEAQGVFELFNLQRGNTDLVNFRFRAVLEARVRVACRLPCDLGL